MGTRAHLGPICREKRDGVRRLPGGAGEEEERGPSQAGRLLVQEAPLQPKGTSTRS